MTDRERSEINISSIGVSGIGGLGLVAMIAVMAYAMPVVRTFTYLSLAGGILGSAAVFAYRWVRRNHASAANRPTLMGHAEAVDSAAKDEHPKSSPPVQLVSVFSAR